VAIDPERGCWKSLGLTIGFSSYPVIESLKWVGFSFVFLFVLLFVSMSRFLMASNRDQEDLAAVNSNQTTRNSVWSYVIDSLGNVVIKARNFRQCQIDKHDLLSAH
jgi:hypothetical protein